MHEAQNYQIEAGGSRCCQKKKRRFNLSAGRKGGLASEGEALHDLQPNVDQRVCVYCRWCRV